MKMMKETSYELLKEDQKKQLSKNNEAKMTLYNALPRKEYVRVFMCKIAKEIWHTLIITYQGNSQVKNCKIDLLTQEYEKFSISNEETIDSGFTRFNAIVTSLKYLDPKKDSSCSTIEMESQGVVKAQDVNVVTIIVVTRITSSVIVQILEGTRLLSEELGGIAKMEMNLKMTNMSYRHRLSRGSIKTIYF
nr:UBN2 domain-containing protein [Tanacetum cinerariifolium]